MRYGNTAARSVCWLEVQLLNVRFHKVGKQQMREQRQTPGARRLFIDNEMNDVAQLRVGSFVIVLELLFQLPNGD